MKKTLAVMALAVCAHLGLAQSIAPVYASTFAQWQLAGQQALVSGSNTVVPFGPCTSFAGGKQFNVLANTQPIRIVDSNPALSETITPTSVVVTAAGCTATLAPTNAHALPYYLISGTAGLQEAINATVNSNSFNSIVLDQAFHNLGGGASTVYAAAGSPNISIKDVTLAVDPAWRWNGTHYVPNYSAPQSAYTLTVAAGAAAGTSPTIANNAGSSPNVMSVALTEGTSPTTGTLFTETFGTAWTTAANCVIQSVGNNVAPPVTVVQTSTTVITFTVASAPTASTAYAFNISCQ